MENLQFYQHCAFFLSFGKQSNLHKFTAGCAGKVGLFEIRYKMWILSKVMPLNCIWRLQQIFKQETR